jgi:aminopeptidase N
MATQIQAIDAINPQTASRLIGAFNRWKKMDPIRQSTIKTVLLRLSQETLSHDLQEMIDKNLA